MQKILIANRGEIAVRIMRTCQGMGIHSVAVYSDADRGAQHTLIADEALYIGPSPVDQSYLNQHSVLAAALQCGATGIHPGYGFLSENAEFARAVIQAGLLWIGPPAAAMEIMASKIRARELAVEHAVPVLPGCTLSDESGTSELARVADIGFPVLLKASAGGGGIGMREVHTADDLPQALLEARAQAMRQFGSGELVVERLLSGARHVEVQIVGDQQGNLLHLFERDCSIQRRRQKLLEEAPAPNLSASMRESLHDAALRLARAVDYHGVGTVEFLVDGDEFFLLEMNTRLQVEHPVTEAICDLDLVRLQLDIASGCALDIKQQDVQLLGHAIEARVYAEDPAANFAPATGTVLACGFGDIEGVRIDSGVSTGSTVGHFYDGLLCKVIAHGDDREQATGRLQRALRELQLSGLQSNQKLLLAVLDSSCWRNTEHHIGALEQRLGTWLEAARPDDDEVQLTLIAATIGAFERQRPVADKVAWPGAYHLSRSTHWTIAGAEYGLEWRWQPGNEYVFPAISTRARVVQALAGNDSILVLEIAGRRLVFQLHEQDESLWLWSSITGAVRLIPARPANTGAKDSADGLCRTPGPGQVLKVLVSAGQPVVAGEGLVVLESMKMESTLTASVAGQVQAIFVQEGDLVESGQVLVDVGVDSKLDMTGGSEA